jgi:hypothetical protein
MANIFEEVAMRLLGCYCDILIAGLRESNDKKFDGRFP